MEDRKERNAPWLSVPQFGDWDQKGELPDYSMDFSKIREMRKQNKRDVSRASLGNEEDFINPTAPSVNTAHNDQNRHFHHHQSQHSPTTRRSFLSYFNCCVKA
ncbi:hypothetical protein LWI28_008273 [Acer negundo]|uniref:RIN4 pathogenic type III effector avirulence factor Avr cleavage site domain-containing protein n=1 Tax=Acer negundo TaxID=4023 RepID=A0AAD5NLG2_ACENE|nr:hypothetical protein LWI28_008273 [Acer negundo]KAK4840562.1 hypothetical protein QYF36_012346 [Acer negundo]